MERFRLRIRNQPKRGNVWELKLFPDRPDHLTREADGRDLGTCSNPEAIYWLQQIAAPFLKRAPDPGPRPADAFSARSKPRWLQLEDGMRLALAFSAAKYLVTAEQRARFQEGLAELPSEVILYWFTLCFYGYRQAAGKAALRTLLTHEEPKMERKSSRIPGPKSPYKNDRSKSFLDTDAHVVQERLAEYASGKMQSGLAGPTEKQVDRKPRPNSAPASKRKRL
jgi:hypothetical protein